MEFAVIGKKLPAGLKNIGAALCTRTGLASKHRKTRLARVSPVSETKRIFVKNMIKINVISLPIRAEETVLYPRRFLIDKSIISISVK